MISGGGEGTVEGVGEDRFGFAGTAWKAFALDGVTMEAGFCVGARRLALASRI